MAYQILLNTWEHCKNNDTRVEHKPWLHRLRIVGHEYSARVVVDVHPGISQMTIVETLKGVKVVGTLLRGAVAAHQMSVEIYTNLGHHSLAVLILRRRYFYTRYHILLPVGSHLPYRQLAAGEYYGLGKILKHIAQRRCSIGHGVGTVKNHKTIVEIVVVRNNMSQVYPSLRRHVTTIDGRIKLKSGNLGRHLLKLWHIAQKALEIERLKGSCTRIPIHPYRSTSVDKQYFIHIRHRLRNF